MTKRIALLAFDREPMCFVHVLLNALDMHDRGYDVKLSSKAVDACSDCSTIRQRSLLLLRRRQRKLIDCVCRRCAPRWGIQALKIRAPCAAKYAIPVSPAISHKLPDHHP